MTLRQQFSRGLFGYRRKDVDAHLAVVDEAIADLEHRVAAATAPDHADLVARATRRSAEEIMAHAELTAVRLVQDAEAQAAQILAAARERPAERHPVIDLRPDDAAVTVPHEHEPELDSGTVAHLFER